METTKMGGWCAIASNSKGDIIFDAADKISHTTDALHSEAIALESGIHIAEQLGISRIIIATDS